MELDILVVALAVLGFALLAGRLDQSPVTMPMLFTAAGLVLGDGVMGVLDVNADSEVVRVLAEVTLVVVLFTDASRMHLGSVLRQHTVAVRMLGVGMPLAMVLGTLVGVWLLPDLALVTVALLAVALAPTDAALGQSFVTAPAVPRRIRQALNVESGLNDGLALPFLLVLIDLAAEDTEAWWSYLGLFALMVGGGSAVGALVGWAGGRLLMAASDRRWTTETTQRIGTLALAAVAYGGAELVGGNGFVAAFVAGLVVGNVARDLLSMTALFAETEGQLLTLLTFLLFGAVMAGGVLAEVTWQAAAYALLSLLVVRPVATAVALVGSRMTAATTAYVGWAGPRGLASIVYAVLIADSGLVSGAEELLTVAGLTILLSILLHGASAAAVSRTYGAAVDRLPADCPEAQPVVEMPVRLPPRRHRHHRHHRS